MKHTTDIPGRTGPSRPVPPFKEILTSGLVPGISAAWPICLGYIPLGLAFGVLGQKAGLGPFEVAVMSFFVFAGSSQFIAIAMMAEHAPVLSIVVTTFFVNLRHFLMSSSLAVFLQGKNRAALSLFAHTITDESFVINFDRFNTNGWTLRKALVLNYTAYASWFLSTVAGACSGRFIPENAWGMDYSLTAMFICLLVYQLKEKIHWVTGITAGIIAVLVSRLIPGNSYIIIASIAAATIGSLLRKRMEGTPREP